MNRAWIVCAALALGTHALILFVFHPGTAAHPQPLAEESSVVEINLIEVAPESAPRVPAPPEPEPAPPTPEPTPESKPELPSPKSIPRPEVKKTRVAAQDFTTATAHADAPVASTVRGPSTSARPRYRSNPKPDYPPEARRASQQGAVMIAVEVTADGRAASVQLSRSSGFPLLDSAALQAVRRWTFEPARIAGIPAASRVEVPVRFDLTR